MEPLIAVNLKLILLYALVIVSIATVVVVIVRKNIVRHKNSHMGQRKIDNLEN